jgi:signal transduction histidine kinase
MRAREHLSEMGEVARGLAHTLRNPLNALGLSVEELASLAPQGGQGEELANSARRQIQRIDHSIRSFLALASEGGGEAVEIDLEQLLHDVALELVQDNGRRAAVTVRAEEGLPRIKGVAPELRAVLQALVANAMEASPAGGRVTARLGPEPGRRVARVEIDDEGPGVAPEVRERLFTPHVTTKATGSGMGLYLAHRIATSRYGGSLDLLPRAAGGTTAVLTLGDRTDGERG